MDFHEIKDKKDFQVYLEERARYKSLVSLYCFVENNEPSEIRKSLKSDFGVEQQNIKKAMDVYSITSGNNQFIIENGKTTVAILETDYTHAVVRMSGKTLQQNIKVVGHTFRRLNNFNLGFLFTAKD